MSDEGPTVVCARCEAVAITGDVAIRLDGLSQCRFGYSISETTLRNTQPEESVEVVGSVDGSQESLCHTECMPRDRATGFDKVQPILAISAEPQPMKPKFPVIKRKPAGGVI